jgi:hypothetical protein
VNGGQLNPRSKAQRGFSIVVEKVRRENWASGLLVESKVYVDQALLLAKKHEAKDLREA